MRYLIVPMAAALSLAGQAWGQTAPAAPGDTMLEQHEVIGSRMDGRQRASIWPRRRRKCRLNSGKTYPASRPA
jgi:hypothetical protein